VNLRKIEIFAIAACALLLVTALTGCGGASKGAGTGNNQSKPAGASDKKNISRLIAGASQMTAEEVSAAEEALRYAMDANVGSYFKACKVKCLDGWARVVVEETGSSVDEAVGFDVYLKKQDGDRWEIVQTGTELSADDLPEAPPEIFEK